MHKIYKKKIISFFAKILKNKDLVKQFIKMNDLDEIYSFYAKFESNPICEKTLFQQIINEIIEKESTLRTLSDEDIIKVSGGTNSFSKNKMVCSLVSIPLMFSNVTQMVSAQDTCKAIPQENVSQHRKIKIGAGATLAAVILGVVYMMSRKSSDTQRPQTEGRPIFRAMGGRVNVIHGSIVSLLTNLHLQVDAVVNAANVELISGGGVCGAIFKAAGQEELQKACFLLPVLNQVRCFTGEAKVTDAFNLNKTQGVKKIIHTPGPHGGENGAADKLANCYRNILKAAADNNCKTIAIPSISTAIYGYNLNEASLIAINTVKEELKKYPEIVVYFVDIKADVYDRYVQLLKEN